MDTSLLYSSVLAQLNQAIVTMTSPEFDALLQQGTVDDRQRAARALLDVAQARLILGNAVLGAIAVELRANEQAFIDGRAELEESLGRLDNIETVLSTVAKFVSVVGRVVTLI